MSASTYVDSIEPREVRKAFANIQKRAEVCGHFGAVLKKRKRNAFNGVIITLAPD